ncbi:MAG: flavodoxin family protein [Christensenellales bacterium]|jgi:multimeric flavodoxin WrbA
MVVVVGSGIKKGNTDKLTDAFIKGVEEAGHTVTKMFLDDKTINACKWGKPCVLKDDMQDIYLLSM